MLEILVDAHFFISILSKKDQSRGPAIRAFEAVSHAHFHTTEEVLCELLNFFCSKHHMRGQSLAMVQKVIASSQYTVHPQTPESFFQALELFRQRPDKGYSLCDCRSMVLMDEIGITKVLTNDDHFVQAGYAKLY